MQSESKPLISCEYRGETFIATIHAPQLRDIKLVSELKEQLVLAAKNGSPQNIILDLSAVEFVGSVGFLAFLAMRRESGIEKIYLCNLRENVHEIFSLCRLISATPGQTAPFTASASVESALGSIV